MNKPRIGSHVSISKGYKEAAVQARSIGGRAFQYFPKNPRSLGVKRFDRGDAERCAAYTREHHMASIAHAPYAVNLAAEDREQRARTAESLLNDLEIAEACGSEGVVVHFGVYKEEDILQGYRNIIDTLDVVLSGWQGGAKLLLENQAGDHAFMGTSFVELVNIRGLSRFADKIGFCLDTCHLYASGVWNDSNGDQWVEHARSLDYFAHLTAVHLNDSMYGSGSRRDRHAAVGQGEIGEKGMRWLLDVPEIRAVPLVLETPEPEGSAHRDQIRLLSEWSLE